MIILNKNKFSSFSYIFLNIISWIVLIVLSISIIFSFLIMYFSFNNSTVTVLNYDFYFNQSNDNEPKIKQNSLLVAKKIDYKNLNVNDIVIIKSSINLDKELLIKKVVEKNSKISLVVTDLSSKNILEINSSQILGKYITHISLFSDISLFISKIGITSFYVLYFGSLIFILSIFIVIYLLSNRQRVLKLKDNDTPKEFDLEKLIEFDENALKK